MKVFKTILISIATIIILVKFADAIENSNKTEYERWMDNHRAPIVIQGTNVIKVSKYKEAINVYLKEYTVKCDNGHLFKIQEDSLYFGIVLNNDTLKHSNPYHTVKTCRF